MISQLNLFPALALDDINGPIGSFGRNDGKGAVTEFGGVHGAESDDYLDVGPGGHGLFLCM